MSSEDVAGLSPDLQSDLTAIDQSMRECARAVEAEGWEEDIPSSSGIPEPRPGASPSYGPGTSIEGSSSEPVITDAFDSSAQVRKNLNLLISGRFAEAVQCLMNAGSARTPLQRIRALAQLRNSLRPSCYDAQQVKLDEVTAARARIALRASDDLVTNQILKAIDDFGTASSRDRDAAPYDYFRAGLNLLGFLNNSDVPLDRTTADASAKLVLRQMIGIMDGLPSEALAQTEWGRDYSGALGQLGWQMQYLLVGGVISGEDLLPILDKSHNPRVRFALYSSIYPVIARQAKVTLNATDMNGSVGTSSGSGGMGGGNFLGSGARSY